MKVFMLSLIKLNIIFLKDYSFGVSINLSQMQDEVKMEVLSHPDPQIGEKITNLFVEYYSDLPKAEVKFPGSGLEGYVVSAIAKQFEIPLESEFIKNADLLKITVRIKKRPVI